MKKWEQLKVDIESSFKAMQLVEPKELHDFRTNTAGTEAGSFGQYWPVIDFAVGMVRDLAGYTMYPMLMMAYNPKFSLEHLKDTYLLLHPPYTEYLGYSGMFELRAFCRRLRECFDEFESKEEFIELYKVFLMYVNKTVAWTYHYFTWELGYEWQTRQDQKQSRNVT